jgi:hypothetical protein
MGIEDKPTLLTEPRQPALLEALRNRLHPQAAPVCRPPAAGAFADSFSPDLSKFSAVDKVLGAGQLLGS